MIILFFTALGILAIDGYVFYSTILATNNEPIPSSQIVFPENELSDFILFLDRREERFKRILQNEHGTSTPLKNP